MKLCPMRFSGYTWHHNPKSLQIKCGKNIVHIDVPFSYQKLQNMGEKLSTVSGTGELYGEDCLEQFLKLQEIYQKGECAVLCLPKLRPMYACFESLSLLANSTPSVLTYSFTFRQVKENVKLEKVKYEHDLDGKTLWDISAEHGVDIDTLVKLNSHIMFIDDLSKTKAVRLC